MGDITDNAHNLSDGDSKQFAGSSRREERKALIHGRWSQRSGSISNVLRSANIGEHSIEQTHD